jgi:hypothetical protein
VGGERGSGPAGVKWAAAVFGLRGKRKKEKNKAGLGWKGLGEGWSVLFFFNSFSFISFSSFYSKPFQNF